ncbi:MAG: type II secretion system F family protein [Candidatus Omnitrophota bacterium]
MPKYSYTAKTEDSRTIKGTTLASSQEELIRNLRSKNLFVIAVKELKEKNRKVLISKFSNLQGKRASVRLYDLTFFARNLSTTLSSGVTLLRSLEIIAYQAESARLSKILRNCCEDIKSGLSFGEAISKYPDVFSSLWRGIIHVGETSGNLPFVLDKLADYLELRMEFERKIKSALVYPAILVGAAVIAIVIFLKFILPKFVSIFEEFDIVLPLPTRIIFAISNVFSKNFLLIIVVLAGLVALFLSFRKRALVRQYWDRVSLKLPIIGKVIFVFYLERITSTIYILLDSGLPVVYALEITAKSVGNSLIEASILYVKDKVREGASLSEELRKIKLFPLLVSEMAKIGEETGTISDVFQKVSVHYRKDLTTRTERIIAAFEPLMIMGMGIVIGGIVISLFMPLFKLSSLGG